MKEFSMFPSSGGWSFAHFGALRSSAQRERKPSASKQFKAGMLLEDFLKLYLLVEIIHVFRPKKDNNWKSLRNGRLVWWKNHRLRHGEMWQRCVIGGSSLSSWETSDYIPISPICWQGRIFPISSNIPTIDVLRGEYMSQKEIVYWYLKCFNCHFVRTFGMLSVSKSVMMVRFWIWNLKKM